MGVPITWHPLPVRWTSTASTGEQACWKSRDAATLEVTLMGPRIEFEEPATVAVTGATFVVTLDERPFG